MAFQYSPKIVTDGLVVLLDAANKKSYPGSGTTWIDLTGNGYNGTLINGAVFSSDNNGVILLDGSNDRIELPTSLQLQTFTIEMFVKLGETGDSWVISNQTVYNNYNNGYLVRINDGYQIFGYVGYGGGSDFVRTYEYDDKTAWLHWVHTYGVNENKVYADLTPDAGATSGLGVDYTDTTGFTIGSARAGQLASTMTLSYFRMYNRVLSSNEILQNYNATKGRFGL